MEISKSKMSCTCILAIFTSTSDVIIQPLAVSVVKWDFICNLTKTTFPPNATKSPPLI